MKIRTSEHLVDFLSAELAWRKKELAILISLVRKNQHNPGKSQALIRSGVAVLYAHWEGFVKAAGTSYLHYVARQSLQYKDLTLPFRALAVKKKFTVAFFSQPIKAEGLLDAIDFLLNRQEETCRFAWEKVIDTRANLNSKVLKEIVVTLGLDYSLYETKEKLINNSLLYYRNRIAHGKGLYPSYDQFEELYREVLGLIELFRNDVENAAVTGAFRL